MDKLFVGDRDFGTGPIKIKSRKVMKFITLAMLIIPIFIYQNLSGAEAVDPKYLRAEKPGEDRPSWWYDVWYEYGTILVGSLSSSEQTKKLSVESIEITEGNAIGKPRKQGLVRASLKIESVLQINSNVNRLNSGAFKVGNSVDIYVPAKFIELNGQWRTMLDLKDGKKHLIQLSEVGFINPGHYYVGWYLDSDFEIIIRKIVAERNLRTKAPGSAPGSVPNNKH